MSTRAERLVAKMYAIPIEDMRRILGEYQQLTPREAVEKQRAARRSQAESARRHFLDTLKGMAPDPVLAERIRQAEEEQ